VKAALLLCLFAVACTPARLEHLSVKSGIRKLSSADLARALDGAEDEAAERALGEWIAKHSKDGAPPAPGGYRVSFARIGTDVFPPDYFDRLEPTAGYRVMGLKEHRIDGTGVSMIGTRENRHTQPVEKWYPPEEITRAVTAVVVPGKRTAGMREVEIRLLDRMRVESVAGKTLAADFTVPFAGLLEKAGPLQTSGFTAMVKVKSSREAGFYLMEPYDPAKTPLLLVHGLFSTPLAWAELTNELWAVPEVRKRYQIWHYLYPTNPPALYSARVMRGQIDELRKFLDPRGKDPAMRRTVIVSHSMGGLLSKSLAVEPKNAFWNAIFTKPLSELNVTPEERATLIEAFYWKPRANVDRIIFCSVPFRGSNIASSWIGSIGRRLTSPTRKFEDFFVNLEKKNPGLFTPDYATITKSRLTSVTTLAPRQRSMEIFDQLPLVNGTKAHIITGATDWVVHRDSATVAGAESNLEVPAGHGSFHHPKAIAEIVRILELPPAR